MYKASRGPRAVGIICSVCRASQSGNARQITRRWLSSQRSALPLKTSHYGWICSLSLAIAFGTSTSLYFGPFRNQMMELHAEAPLVSLDNVPERPVKRKIRLSKEENRDSLSSQHLQVKKSWENPGVYAWGSNTGRVVAPDSVETLIKAPRRIPAFDGVLLRDIKLDRDFGVAVTEKGDLLQWGTAYSSDSTHPTPTLTGKDLVSVQISQDRVIGLSSSGKVYSLPVAKTDQLGWSKTSQETPGFPLRILDPLSPIVVFNLPYLPGLNRSLLSPPDSNTCCSSRPQAVCSPLLQVAPSFPPVAKWAFQA